MDSAQLGRWLVLVGGVIVVLGLVLWGSARINLPLGRLPGDLSFGGEGWQVSIPLVSSIVISIVATVLLNLAARFWNK